MNLPIRSGEVIQATDQELEIHYKSPTDYTQVEIATLYAKALDTAGWTLEPPQSIPRTIAVRGSLGTDWITLMVVQVGSDAYEVHAEVE